MNSQGYRIWDDRDDREGKELVPEKNEALEIREKFVMGRATGWPVSW